MASGLGRQKTVNSFQDRPERPPSSGTSCLHRASNSRPMLNSRIVKVCADGAFVTNTASRHLNDPAVEGHLVRVFPRFSETTCSCRLSETSPIGRELRASGKEVCEATEVLSPVSTADKPTMPLVELGGRSIKCSKNALNADNPSPIRLNCAPTVASL